MGGGSPDPSASSRGTRGAAGGWSKWLPANFRRQWAAACRSPLCWAHAKPAPSDETYRLLGEAAARITVRPTDSTLHHRGKVRCSGPYRQSASADEAAAPAGGSVADSDGPGRTDAGTGRRALPRSGHLSYGPHPRQRAWAEDLTVFDFDSAGTCWRAVEPWGVLRFSRTISRCGWPDTEQCGLSAEQTRRPWRRSESSVIFE